MSDVQPTASSGSISSGPPASDAYPTLPQAKLRVPETAAKTWRVFRERPWTFSFLALVPLVATLLAAVVPAAVRAQAGAGTTVIDQILVSLVQYGAQFICQNATVYGAACLAERQFFGFGEALGVGARRLPSYFVVVILAVIALFLGLVLFVIPAVIVAVYICLAAPACVIERRGPIASLDRSVRLVRGNWWRVVGVGMLGGFLPFLGALAAVGVVAAALSPMNAAPWSLILLAPVYVVFVAISAIMAAVLFLEIRSVKEGTAPPAVAGVFD